MALIVCSECEKVFSDKAAYCPNCGCPTEIVKKERANLELIVPILPIIDNRDNFQKSVSGSDDQKKNNIPIITVQIQQDNESNPTSHLKEVAPVSAGEIDKLYSEHREVGRTSDLGTPKKNVQINTMGPSSKTAYHVQQSNQSKSIPSTKSQSPNSSMTCIGICCLILLLGFIMQSCNGGSDNSGYSYEIQICNNLNGHWDVWSATCKY